MHNTVKNLLVLIVSSAFTALGVMGTRETYKITDDRIMSAPPFELLIFLGVIGVFGSVSSLLGYECKNHGMHFPNEHVREYIPYDPNLLIKQD